LSAAASCVTAVILELGANDLIAADEGFNFAGHLQVTLSDASEHATHVRERLGETQRPQA